MIILFIICIFSFNTEAFEIRFEVKDLARIERIAEQSFCNPVKTRVGTYPYYKSSCKLSDFQISEIEKSIHFTPSLLEAQSILVNTHPFIPLIKHTLLSTIYKDLLGNTRTGKTQLSYIRDFKIYAFNTPITYESNTDLITLKEKAYKYYDFRYFDFRGKKVSKIRFEYSFFYKADFSGSDLRQVSFLNCDLKGALFNLYTKLPFSYDEAISKGMVAR